jgi:hypothetical protein
MSDDKQFNGLSVVTVEAAKQKMAIALTKLSLSSQKMQDEADSLVFNEDQDNLDKIKSFIEKTKKAEKSIEDEHKIGKAPFFQAGKAWDNAKNDSIKIISDIKDPVIAKYTSLCNEIDRKAREEAANEAKKKEILAGIEANVLSFSQKIANCGSKKELTDIERLINLEKSESRAVRYGEFHKNAIDRFNDVLLPIIRDQKVKIEEKEAIEKKLAEEVDPEKHDELKEKLEEKENEIIQNKVQVQENALNQAPTESVEPTYITPFVKAKRTDIVPEIVDVVLVFKKQRALLSIDLKVADAKKLGETLKSSGAFGDNNELIIDGIKFTIKKSW